MKKIFLILIIFVLTANISYAADNCRKYNNLLEQKKYKECLAQNPSNKKDDKLIN